MSSGPDRQSEEWTRLPDWTVQPPEILMESKTKLEKEGWVGGLLGRQKNHFCEKKIFLEDIFYVQWRHFSAVFSQCTLRCTLGCRVCRGESSNFSLSLSWSVERKILILPLHLDNSEPSVLHCPKDTNYQCTQRKLSFLHIEFYNATRGG